MNSLHIRNVLPSDLDKVTEIEAICFPAAEKAPRKVFQERIAAFPQAFFVAILDNKIIGFINGGATNKDKIEDEFFSDMKHNVSDGANLVIFGLDVLPKYQKKGYATALMNHFIDKAKQDGRKRILLTCKEHLISYYQKFGYVNEGVSQSVHGGAKWYDMSLVL